MSFASLVFLFLFLPLCLVLVHASPARWRNAVLLVMSLLFYSWGEGLFVLLMLASIGGNWACGLWLGRVRPPRARKLALALAVGWNLGLLGAFKYGAFLAANLNAPLAALGLPTLGAPALHLPIGISFFTFQALSYVIDVYRRDAGAERNPLRLALYISLFPQLVAGPIVRYRHIAAQLRQRSVDLEGFAWGVRRFIVGLAKKVLIANTLGVCVDPIFALPATQLSLGLAWVGAFAFALQIYFDFSGYSDMAIGLGRMLGFRFLENFDTPYVARSLTEFWRRWHISLSTWFRDYLYIPLGGNRCSPLRVQLNLLTVFFLCGLWHGASWTFVVWGLFHGTFLMIERAGLSRGLARCPAWLRHVYVAVALLVGWAVFRADSLAHAAGLLSAMFGGAPLSSAAHPLRLYVTNDVVVAALVGCVAALPLGRRIARWFDDATARPLPLARAAATGAAGALAALFVLAVSSLAAGTHNPFIYFRF